MSIATYILRIECDYARGEWTPEVLGALLCEAETLVSDGLPEGWYAKIESPDEHLGAAVRPMETYGKGGER